jgi:dTDP-4-dehydrorhamnose 3,5-epimerase
MIFRETSLPGVFIIDLDPRRDDRGFFARTWCVEEARAHGIDARFVQSSVSFSPAAGTLRGLCFQRPPFEEDKLVRCARGTIQDVVVDLRMGSPTYLEHLAVELSGGNRRMLFVPRGLAHGFLTLQPETEVCYNMTEFYAPDFESGIRWDDPLFGIQWWRDVESISDRDASRPNFARAEALR